MFLGTEGGEGRSIVKVDSRLTATTTSTTATALATTLSSSLATATFAAETTALILLNEALLNFNMDLLLLGLVLLLKSLALSKKKANELISLLKNFLQQKIFLFYLATEEIFLFRLLKSNGILPLGVIRALVGLTGLGKSRSSSLLLGSQVFLKSLGLLLRLFLNDSLFSFNSSGILGAQGIGGTGR